MVVQWVTKNSSNPTVKWGTSPGTHTYTAAASSSTYTRQELCGAPANAEGFVDPGLFHAALLEGLEPGQRYYYIVGDEVRAMIVAGDWCNTVSGAYLCMVAGVSKGTISLS
jgi:hypothetical protein